MAKGVVPPSLMKSRPTSTPVASQKSKIGPTEGLTDRNVARVESLGDRPGLGDNRTLVDTYFTASPIPGEQPAQIYTGDRWWARVSLTLETAGPVAVATSTKVTPVLGGNGRLLKTGETITFTLAKGTKLYVASTGVNRIGRVIEPVPWLEQIVGLTTSVLDTMSGIFRSLASGKR